MQAPPLPHSLASSSSSAHIFWDLDNVRPSSLQELQDLGTAISAAVLELAQCTQQEPQSGSKVVANEGSSRDESSTSGIDKLPVGLTVFANPTTFSKLSSSTALDDHRDLKSVVESLDGTLVRTTGRKQSVDLAMKSAMLEYAKHASTAKTIKSDRDEIKDIKLSNLTVNQDQSNRQDLRSVTTVVAAAVPILACVSDDSDFVQMLKYCGSLGCTTVSIGEHKGRKRPAWATPRRLHALPLPAAAAVAITLRRPSGSDNCRERWSVAGVWVNPNSPCAS